MIRFNRTDDNKQYVSIHIRDGKAAPDVFNYLRGLYLTINNLPCAMDNEEIIIEISGNSPIGFSLGDLRRTLKRISANIVVGHFCVDLSDKSQRVYCIYG